MGIDLEKRGDGVAVVTLNRPHVLNALDVPAKETLGAIWLDLAADDSVRAVLLCGAGPKAFCAGSDIKEMRRTGRMVTTETLMAAIPGARSAFDKPVIAALHGYTLGMGLTLALHCDLRIAQSDTKLAFPEVQKGMISGVTALRLPSIVGRAKALEWLLLGQTIPLEEAQATGFVNSVVADAKGEAEKWAVAIARAPSCAVQATKRLATFGRILSEAEKNAIATARDEVEKKGDFRSAAAKFANPQPMTEGA